MSSIKIVNTVFLQLIGTAYFHLALICSVVELAEKTQIMKCMYTQGLSNHNKKIGRGLKTASVEAIWCKIRVL